MMAFRSPVARGLASLAGAALLLAAAHPALAQQEDCVAFDPRRIEVQRIGSRWKLVEQSHWIMDFAGRRTEAEQAQRVIRQYGYDHICYIGRPNPSMTYFVSRAQPTTVVIVRHAEKLDESANPPLTEAGQCRAETLSRMLAPSGISAVFATALLRTRQTVTPYAQSRMPALSIETYGGAATLAERIRTGFRGRKVLVASHSGMAEELVALLGAPPVPAIGNEFDNAYVVTLPASGPATVLHTKYEIWDKIVSATTPCHP